MSAQPHGHGARPYERDAILFALRHYFELADGTLVPGQGEVRVHRPRYEAPFCSLTVMKSDIDMALAGLIVERHANINGTEVVVSRNDFTLHCVWGHAVIGHDFRTLAEILRSSVEPVQRRFWEGIETMTDSLNGRRPFGPRSPQDVQRVISDLMKWMNPG